MQTQLLYYIFHCNANNEHYSLNPNQALRECAGFPDSAGAPG